MRVLTFTQITDSRFDSDIAATMRERKRKIISLLRNMENVEVSHEVDRKLSWTDGTEQIRCRFTVKKCGRKTTWNNIFKAVNSVYAVPYKFINE